MADMNQRRLAVPVSSQTARLRLPMPPKFVLSERFSKAFPEDAGNIIKYNEAMVLWWSQLNASVATQNTDS